VTAPQPSVLSVKVSAQAAQLSAGSARLEELKEQVRNGTFKVDARAIANVLVGDE
jgi:anti-sigma28 factor (negative regulator of flagellin synthesis)